MANERQPCYLPPVPPGHDNPDAPPETDGRGGSPTPGAADGVERYADALVELNALLGRGTSYSGKLHFVGRVRIEGTFDGEIRSEDVLVIGQGADVRGSIEVGVCIVTGGNVQAGIRAREAIELHAPGRVKGDLHAPNIFIDRGVQFEGNCKMAPLDDVEGEVGDEPTERTTNPGPPPSVPNDEAVPADGAAAPPDNDGT